MFPEKHKIIFVGKDPALVLTRDLITGLPKIWCVKIAEQKEYESLYSLNNGEFSVLINSVLSKGKFDEEKSNTFIHFPNNKLLDLEHSVLVKNFEKSSRFVDNIFQSDTKIQFSNDSMKRQNDCISPFFSTLCNLDVTKNMSYQPELQRTPLNWFVVLFQFCSYIYISILVCHEIMNFN